MAVDIILDLEGVKGELRKDGFKDKIDIEAWSWGVTQSSTTHQGGGGGGGRASFQDMSIVKFVDTASATLLQFCTIGKHINKGKLICRKVSGEKPADYLVYELEEVIVTSISSGGSGGNDLFQETITLNFRKFKVDYKVQDDKGVATTAGTFTYDIAAQKA